MELAHLPMDTGEFEREGESCAKKGNGGNWLGEGMKKAIGEMN